MPPARRRAPRWLDAAIALLLLGALLGAVGVGWRVAGQGARQRAALAWLAPRLAFHLVKEVGASSFEFGAIDERSELVLLETDRGSGSDARWYRLVREPALAGADVRDVTGGIDEMGQPILQLTFNPPGAERFARLTGQHVGEQLAIVVDNRVVSAPVIQSRITGGQAQITGLDFANYPELAPLVGK